MTDGGTHTNAAADLPGRLKTRAEFLRVQKGERRKGPLFLLEVNRRDDAGPPRVGYTVTKRQGNSVERNRMRRRLREAVRIAGGFAMQPGHDYVIVARRDLLDAAFSRLTSALRARIEGRHEKVRPERRPRDVKTAGAVGAEEPKSDRPDCRSDNICPSGTNDGH